MNKNLRTVKLTVTSQTLFHLNQMAAMCGWGQRDIGRVVDKLVRTHLETQRVSCERKNKGDKFNARERN